MPIPAPGTYDVASQVTLTAVKAKTDIIGASVALEAAGNLAAVKARTFLFAPGGSGVLGSKIVSSNESIPGNVIHEYTSFTIDSGVVLTLTAAGRMIIRCVGKVTIAGTINLAGYGVGGAAPSGGAGAAGVAGSAQNNGGLISGGGGSGGAGKGPTYGGANGALGGSSTDIGCGAAGVAGTGTATASTPAQSNGGDGAKYNIVQELEYMQSVKTILNGGAGGAAGANSASGGTGGAGGAGGGCLYIEADEVEVTATGLIAVNGNAGGNGTYEAAYACGSGGGGGGGGGCILIRTRKYTNAGSVTVAGGAGGAGGAGTNYGSNGGAGGVGNLKVILE